MGVLLLLVIIIPLILVYVYSHYNSQQSDPNSSSSSSISLFRTHNLPKPYSLIRLILIGDEDRLDYLTGMLGASLSSTVTVHVPGGGRVFTANRDNTRHVLKTRFSNYRKTPISSSPFIELFGRGLFNVDGEEWSSQRHFLSTYFTKWSVRGVVEAVIEPCISNSLLPDMTDASRDGRVVDLQDVFQRFGFDTTCKIAFGYDPDCLSRTSAGAGDELFQAYKQAVSISTRRMKSIFPFSMLWRTERLLNAGSQRRLMGFVRTVRGSALSIIQKNIQGHHDHQVFLARAIQHYNGDDNMVIDLIVNAILAGYETVASALTWFFWLVTTNPEVEEEILMEIKRVEDAKDMVYTHAALCESMRLYPPVPADTRDAIDDDVLPDGTRVTKGTRIVYSIYSMGRSERIWGPDWAQYNPKRWLRWDDTSRMWVFVPRDPYTYTVFNAGPRICLGMDLAFLQMKTVVARVLPEFKVMPCMNKDPIYLSELTSMMKGGLLVRLEQRSA